MIYYLLYNPYACNGDGKRNAELLELVYCYEQIEYIDITQLQSYADFFAGLAREDIVVLCGGDGTLNRFVNDTRNVEIENEILYFSCGNGENFSKDLFLDITQDDPFRINEYIKKLPIVKLNGQEGLFINGIGFGFSESCDKNIKQKIERTANDKIADVKDLIANGNPTNVTVVVDGKEYKYENVWMTVTMYGRFYGNERLLESNSNRTSEDKTLYQLIFYKKNKLKTLKLLSSIFKENGVEKEKGVEILKGKAIMVKFDEPRIVQIDGEKGLCVTEYNVKI